MSYFASFSPLLSHSFTVSLALSSTRPSPSACTSSARCLGSVPSYSYWPRLPVVSLQRPWSSGSRPSTAQPVCESSILQILALLMSLTIFCRSLTYPIALVSTKLEKGVSIPQGLFLEALLTSALVFSVLVRCAFPHRTPQRDSLAPTWLLCSDACRRETQGHLPCPHRNRLHALRLPSVSATIQCPGDQQHSLTSPFPGITSGSASSGLVLRLT